MDNLFLEGGSERRRFLDRLVYNYDPEHASTVYSYEYLVRERAKMLQENPDPIWLSTVEAKMAAKAVSITAGRLKVLDILQEHIGKTPTEFPRALLSLHGEVEEYFMSHSAEDAQELLCKKWCDDRSIDARSKRTQMGVHRSDFSAIYKEKNMPASSCSTGEQKALVLSIILAQARSRGSLWGGVPVMLLDEIVSHLDENRREALFAEFLDLNAQVWMTGTDPSLFEVLGDRVQYVNLEKELEQLAA
jgi:DNA replication and repair protein RecF